MNRRTEVFNSPVEMSLRCLIILVQMKKPVTLDKLLMFDYLSLNTGDVGGPPSLHPPIPHRSVQLLVRRELVQKGLRLLISKGLVRVILNKKGILYTSTKLGLPFLELLDSDYKKTLVERVDWTLSEFNNKSEKSLSIFIQENLDKWGGEITIESTRME